MIKKILLLCVLATACSYGVKEENIKKVIESKTQQVINILKDSSLSQTKKEKKSIKVMDPLFSYKKMAKISLAKKWKTLSKEEKKAFTKAFEHKIKYAYIDKLKLYKNQKIIISEPKKIKNNRLTLTSKIIGKNETFIIVNSFYKKKNTKEWYIYDVKLAGVSIMQTYRKQFKAFLKTKSFKQLLNSL